jgi:hypothetical protein
LSKIVVVCNDSAYFLRHRAAVCEALVEQGHEVLVMLGGDRLDGLGGGLAYAYVPIERFKFDPMRDFGLFRASLRQLRRQKPAALHAITLKPALFSGIAVLLHRLISRQPVRLVITIPGLGRLMSPESRLKSLGARMNRRIVLSVLRFIASRNDVHFTFETRHDRDLWRSLEVVDDKNSLVIAGAGVDGKLYSPMPNKPP